LILRRSRNLSSLLARRFGSLADTPSGIFDEARLTLLFWIFG